MLLLIETKDGWPLHFPDKEDMSDEELFDFCRANPHLRVERDENSQIYLMAPVGGETGRNHIKVASAIDRWNSERNAGETFDSSTGFKLMDKSMRSPDAAWITAEKWRSLSEQERKRFLPFAPDFVVEMQSPSDDLEHAQAKMHKWIRNGVRLGWLIVPEQKLVFVYRADGTVDKVEGFNKTLSGEDVLPGFEFNLSVLL